jgi:hypothetical protein
MQSAKLAAHALLNSAGEFTECFCGSREHTRSSSNVVFSMRGVLATQLRLSESRLVRHNRVSVERAAEYPIGLKDAVSSKDATFQNTRARWQSV